MARIGNEHQGVGPQSGDQLYHQKHSGQHKGSTQHHYIGVAVVVIVIVCGQTFTIGCSDLVAQGNAWCGLQGQVRIVPRRPSVLAWPLNP